MRHSIYVAILGVIIMAQGCTSQSGSTGIDAGCTAYSNCGEDISSQSTDVSSGDATSSPADVSATSAPAEASPTSLPDGATTTTPIPQEWNGSACTSKKFFGPDQSVGEIKPYGFAFANPGFVFHWSEFDKVDIAGRKFHVCQVKLGVCDWVDVVKLKTD